MRKIMSIKGLCLFILAGLISLSGRAQSNMGTIGIDFETWVDSNNCPEKLRSYSLAEFDTVKIGKAFREAFRSLAPVPAAARPGSTGEKSLAIVGKTVTVEGRTLSIPGLVTSGSIVLQSLDPGTPDTLNYTHTVGKSAKTTNSLFSMTSSWKPDSVIFWAKHKIPAGSESNGKARVQILIGSHNTSNPMSQDLKSFYADTALYRSLYGERESKQYSNRMSRTVEVEIEAGNGEWKRYSVPFSLIDKSISSSASSMFAQVSITNGTGTPGDTLFIDDLQFMQMPTATVSIDRAMVFNAGAGTPFDTLTVTAKSLKGSFDYVDGKPNAFVIDLSDANGSFETFRTLAESEEEIKSTMSWSVVVPGDVPAGGLYRVRLRSTNPAAEIYRSLQFRIEKEYVAQEQIPFSDFEIWQNEGLQEVEPLGWHSFYTAKTNMLTAFGLAQRVQPSLDVRPGSTGKTSAQIWSTWAMLAAANGNLTTGRINMGAILPPTDITGNYNFSDTTDPGHALPFTAKPDSLTFWVKYLPADSAKEYGGEEYMNEKDMRAAVTVVIHDDCRYQDPNIDTVGTGMEKSVVAKAQQLIPSTEGKWVRYSVPFVYTANTDARYMLVSATTNIIPAAGVTEQSTHSDSVWIDDMLLIYNPKVSVRLASAEVAAEATSLNFTANLQGTFNPSNTANPADSNRLLIEVDTVLDFGHAITVYEGKAEAGEISAMIDLTQLSASTTYFVRARTTNYPAVSEPVQLHVLDARTIFVATASTEGALQASARVYRNDETTPLTQDTVVNLDDRLTFVYEFSGDERFAGWFENTLLVSEADTFVIEKAVRDYHMVAKFVPGTAVLTLGEGEITGGSVIVTYAASGDTVKDLAKVRIPEEVTLTAIPDEGYEFDYFSTGNHTILSAESPYTFTMVSDTTIHVYFRFEASNEWSAEADIRVYPNPVKDVLHVKGENLYRMEVYSLLGQKVLEADLRQTSSVSGIRPLKQGIYLYRIFTADGRVVSGRFIKQ